MALFALHVSIFETARNSVAKLRRTLARHENRTNRQSL
jgi:hypothetical protein